MELVRYEDNGGEVTFTAEDIKARLCPGIEDKELAYVMALCQAQRLNPFMKDVHIVKYGNNPAQVITSKDVFSKRANANPDYRGFKAGVTVLNARGEIIKREGSAFYKVAGEQLIGGWCQVFVNGKEPFYDEVTLDEYSTGKSLWASKPATMIRKVAYVHALREAFPDDFQGLYSTEEMGHNGEVAEQMARQPIPDEPVVIEPEAVYEEPSRTFDELALEFAASRGRTFDEVVDAVLKTNAMAATDTDGISTVDDMSEEQLEIGIRLLNQWMNASGNGR